MAEQHDLYDVTIIGGGPVGLFTAFYSGMREMKTKIIEYLPFLGGKVPYFYPEKIIRDVGGIPQKSGELFTEDLIKQAKTFNPTIVLKEQVVGITRLKNGHFQLTSRDGQVHNTKTVILATGYGILKSTKLELPEAPTYENDTLHYTIQRMASYQGKHVFISGGGNSAIDWANELEPIAKQVTLIHRKPTFRGMESNISKMKNSSVKIKQPYHIKSLHGERSKLSHITLQHADTKEIETLHIDNLIISHGFQIDLGSINDWGMEMENGSIKVDSTMSTSIPGIFAVGDIANYPNKLHLIAGGFNEGPIAVNAAKQFIDPEHTLSHLFSTNYEPFRKE
ncbi:MULTISPECIES: NAD(P)/FAD-dependent oxidoreductase [Virgibacillus]|uniref:Ferredoxin--NADP reductase n=2 Tax=Virgibacillus TaxID=84406 RepID=A0A024Q9R9_9BACI|nr:MULTISPECIES: NAD(P)/FAD-dependent oxidoreductase [Virgibacillus]EQB37257.1 hypothetical protein M948_01610 [Virgibacillus sp. CM-4]MYL40014.1 thioredoxin reductase [Virgibacillus massiliensis]GGJ62845.1 ferredoxin--NADP reductase 1 [Virgibacillus kapii]CDQ39244.1 Ferredoxin--NADP reductase 2 [Virgibacillus massiliensis]